MLSFSEKLTFVPLYIFIKFATNFFLILNTHIYHRSNHFINLIKIVNKVRTMQKAHPYKKL